MHIQYLIYTYITHEIFYAYSVFFLRPQFRYISTPDLEAENKERFTHDVLKWIPLEGRPSLEDPEGLLYLPGGGIAKSLFEDWLVTTLFFTTWNNPIKEFSYTFIDKDHHLWLYYFFLCK